MSNIRVRINPPTIIVRFPFAISTSGGGFASPLTTKGDVLGFDTDNARIPVGTDGQALVADSAEDLGVKWGDVTASPGGADTQVQVNNSGSFDGFSEFIWSDALKQFEIIGTEIINHTSSVIDEKSLHIITDAAGFGNVSAIKVNYDAGALAADNMNAINLVNINAVDTVAGSSVFGLGVITTAGAGDNYALGSGPDVNPILQFSGTFGDIDDGKVNGSDETANLNNISVDNAVFAVNSDNLLIGNAATFTQISVNLTTPSNRNTAITFEYSIGGTSFAVFVPEDGTNDFQNNGAILWDVADLTGWATNTSGNFEIRMTRTRVGSMTTPQVKQLQSSATTAYEWDKTGKITARTVNTEGGTLAFPGLSIGSGDSGLAEITTGELSIVSDGIEVARADTTVTEQFIINPQADLTGTASAPSLALGDADSGLYEISDDKIGIATGGTLSVQIDAFRVRFGFNDNSPMIPITFASATVPVLIPRGSDSNTGVGRAANDQLSLIAGGIEGLRVEEGNSGATGTQLFIPNLTTAPSSNPTAGGYMYTESGALKYRGSSGTITTIAVA